MKDRTQKNLKHCVARNIDLFRVYVCLSLCLSVCLSDCVWVFLTGSILLYIHVSIFQPWSTSSLSVWDISKLSSHFRSLSLLGLKVYTRIQSYDMKCILIAWFMCCKVTRTYWINIIMFLVLVPNVNKIKMILKIRFSTNH